MPDLTLGICGLRIRLTADDARLLDGARRRYASFRAGGRPDLELSLEPAPRASGPDRIVPRVRRDGRRWRIERHDLALDLGPRGGSAALRRGPAPLDSLLRIVLSFALPARGGFLCHSAAVGGWLFPGRSGAGKSTLGRRAGPERLLADELVGVVRSRLYATPFWGDFRAGRNNGRRRLRGIFFLDRRAPRGVRPLPKPRALANLLRCVLCFDDRAETGRRLLALARSCVASVPTAVLSYDARRTPFAALEPRLEEAAG